MPSILKREFAPVSDQAWKEIDELAAAAVKRNLSGRSVVDFSGPHGWELAAVNEGRLVISGQEGPQGIDWGKRKVTPLIEIRAPFTIAQMELDNITRGCVDPKMDELEEVVGRAARFEETLIYRGFEEGGISGMLSGSEQEPVVLPERVEEYTGAVAGAVERLELSGIEGPYALVLGPTQYYSLMQSPRKGYPEVRIIRDILQGDVLKSPVLNGGVLLSVRGGDFELTIGKDFSIGYASHDRDRIEFFVTESLAFRIVEPKAIVALTLAQ